VENSLIVNYLPYGRATLGYDVPVQPGFPVGVSTDAAQGFQSEYDRAINHKWFFGTCDANDVVHDH
jgi:hypothetical protein